MKKVIRGSSLKLLIAMMLIFSLFTPSISFAQSNSIKPIEENKVVESFVIDIIEENSNGLYETTGYKYIDSITESAIVENQISTKISAVEDYYDLNGKYLKTVIKTEEFINNLDTGKALSKVQENEVNKSLARNSTLSHNVGTINLTNDEQDKVETFVNKEIKKLPDVEYVEVEGFTNEKLNEIRKLAVDSIQYYQENPQAISSTQNAGAFDNFYRYNTSTTEFHLQALGAVKKRYLVYTGKTLGTPLNGTSYNKFKGYIDNYEYYIINQMKGATFWEVAGWWGNVVGLVSLVVGYAAGPGGWAAIVANYSGALSLFIGLTSSTYATYSRLQYSRQASANLESARTMLFNGGSYFKNTKLSTVSGF